jgi:membrane-associated phospholipid phosphatase
VPRRDFKPSRGGHAQSWLLPASNVCATRAGQVRLASVSHRAVPYFLPACLLVWSVSAPAQELQGLSLSDPARGDLSQPGTGRGDVARVPAAPVEWDPAWPRFQAGEWLASGLGLATLIASRALPIPAAHWQGGFGFDEAARTALRLHTPSARRWARDASDIGVTISASWPFFDALVIAGWYRNSPDVGLQQALISLEVMSVTAGLQGLVSLMASRERPYGRECGGEVPADTRDCVGRDRYYSFYSGHSSVSFAAAAVNCMHHAYVPLYGGGAADDWACVGMFGVAAATAVLRVATDVHYVSDVLVGATIGTTTGLLLPWALHYRHGASTRERSLSSEAALEPRWSLLPLLSPHFGGLSGALVF